MCIQVFCWGFDELLNSMLWIARAGHGTLWISPFSPSPCRPFYTCTSYAFFCQTEQLSNEKRAPSCLGVYIYGIYIWDCTTQLCGNYKKPLFQKSSLSHGQAWQDMLHCRVWMSQGPIWFGWKPLVKMSGPSWLKCVCFFSDEVVTLSS